MINQRTLALAFGLAAVLATLHPSVASAQSYAVGQRLECDPMGLKKYYKPGVVIAFHLGEKYNGYPAGSGYFYRVRLDGGAVEGVLCKAEDTRSAGAAAAVSARGVSVAQAAGGNRFGTREPRACAPVKNQPSIEQIKALIQCDDEKRTRDLLYLDEHISVQTGGTRAYSEFSDGYSTGIDTNAQVLPISGSLDAYQCAALSKYTNTGTTYDTDNTGKSCAISPVRQSTGTCYRTTLGEWRCHLKESIDITEKRLNQPPPGR